MVKVSHIIVLALAALLFSSSVAFSQAATGQKSIAREEYDQELDGLLKEAEDMLSNQRPIDARTTLQKALQIAPKDYRPYLALGIYYLNEVGHFKLAMQYISTAKKLFEEKYGNNDDNSFDLSLASKHAILLYLTSEAQLNLDLYQDSLNTLDVFAKNYRMDWYPGTKAWVLMKLKRLDEAIKVAQAGILNKQDPRRTWNILGILLSVKDNRELSLHAFSQAVKAELSEEGTGQIATPLNNAGEVYRELFSDEYAEASFRQAVKLPDGCEHILPWLNLAIMGVDQLRLFQAEQDLNGFLACFASRPMRQDSEHRTLVALQQGRIALHKNEIDKSISLLTIASEEEQWFGKIGTNENDVRFAAIISLAQAMKAKIAALKDEGHNNYWKDIRASAQIPYYRILNWWHNHQARDIGFEELNDFEDLSIRNTDTMIEYPTFGSLLADFNPRGLAKRIKRILEQDSRANANAYYNLYLGSSLNGHGEASEAEKLLQDAYKQFRPIDRLAKAETLAQLILAKKKLLPWFGEKQQVFEIYKLTEELYSIHPARLRYYDLTLPVKLVLKASDLSHEKQLKSLAAKLLDTRFISIETSNEYSPSWTLEISSNNSDTQNISFQITLSNSASDLNSTVENGSLNEKDKYGAEAINKFIQKAFALKVDSPAPQLTKPPILEGVM